MVSKLMGRTVNNITPHWLRHTFATWTIMDVANAKGIILENTGLMPHPLLLNALQVKLGHADPLTTLRYISTALKLMGLDLNDGHIKMSLNRFKNCIKSQELVKREEKIEFAEDFDDEYFNVIRYNSEKFLMGKYQKTRTLEKRIKKFFGIGRPKRIGKRKKPLIIEKVKQIIWFSFELH